MFSLRSLSLGLTLMFGLFVFTAGNAKAATTTICTIGCDYTTLYDAVSADLPGQDGFEVQNGYVFDQGLEGGGNVTLPVDSFLTCDPGVTLGNGEGSLVLNSNENTTIDSCRFDGVTLRAENVQNVTWNDNDFETTTRSAFHLFDVTTYAITNNEGSSHVRMFNADQGTIEGNSFECQQPADFGLACIHSTFITIVSRPSATTDDPQYNSNDVLINNNDFHYGGTNFMLFVDFFGGTDLTMTNNRVLQDQIPDSGVGAVRLFDTTGVTVSHNFFDLMLPDDSMGGGMTGISIAGEKQIEVTVEHNLIIYRGVDSPSYNICFRTDRYFTPNPLDEITFRYNICTATDSVIENGFYVDQGTLDTVNFTEQHNAFYPVVDAFWITGNGPIPADPTTFDDVKPIFRTENADPNDDLELNPASPLLDVNGSTDIGLLTGTKISTYTIDDDCIVDYATCVSNKSDNLQHLIKSNDTVTIAAGTYQPINVLRAVNNASIAGSGTSTTIDAQLTSTGLNIVNATNLDVSDLRIINTISTGGSSYTATNILFSDNGNDYDDSDLLFGIPNQALLSDDSTGCILGTLAADGDPLPVADGVNNIHGYLFDFGGGYISGLTTSSAMLICGVVPITVKVQDLFIANGDGTYTYNPTALTTAGVSLKAGITTPPSITRTLIADATAGGLRLENTSNNTFTNIVFENNESGITFIGSSDNNRIIDGNLTANNGAIDITSSSTGSNTLFNTAFNVAKTDFFDIGTVTARYDTAIRVIDSLSTPLAGITVTQVSANGLFSATGTTDGSGLIATTSSIAFVLDTANHTVTGGNYNPYTLTALRSGQNATTSINVNIFEQDTFDVMMNVVTTTPPSVSSGGGGSGGLPTVKDDGTYPPVAFDSTQSTGDTAPLPKSHYLVKAPDDKNPNTTDDSTVYYIGADDKKHPFTNQSIFFSWYCDFSQVRTISTYEIARYPVGASVTYRPGLRLTKFITSPIVYVVQPGRMLRPIADEETAAKLFGPKWASMVTDLEDTFYRNYNIGNILTSFTDTRHLDYTPRYPSGELDIKDYKDIMVQASLQACKQ